jgi:hypothetical protein
LIGRKTTADPIRPGRRALIFLRVLSEFALLKVDE